MAAMLHMTVVAMPPVMAKAAAVVTAEVVAEAEVVAMVATVATVEVVVTVAVAAKVATADAQTARVTHRLAKGTLFLKPPFLRPPPPLREPSVPLHFAVNRATGSPQVGSC